MSARGLAARRGRFELTVNAFDADGGGTVVLGPNGAGKTTLLLALQGLIPAEGTIERGGRSAAVFAQPAVLRGAILWNVAIAARSVLGLTHAESDNRARRALNDAGLTGDPGADARTLSTGQRQRLALARALACEPQALFLDEAFANIDADGRPALRELVRSYADRSGCALVVATSSLADAVALCRSAVVLRSGAVTHGGPVGGLAAAGDAFVDALIAEDRAGA